MIDAKTALLQALISGDGYGLELMGRVEALTNGKMSLGQGTIYPALRALERDGLVETYDGESTADRGGRPRIYYRITGEGRRAAFEERKAASGLFGLAWAELSGA